MPVTQFQPSQHGFHFSNNDLKLPQKGGTVLCGGMTYAAIDYFVNGMTVPHDIEAPPNGTPLNSYIFNRQVAAHVSTANKFAAIFVPIPLLSPLLSGVSTFPDVEFNKLINKLSTGKPCPICLANPGGSGHHLVAMGCNATLPITITAYDPNAPGKTAIIQEFKAPGGRKFRNSMGPSKQWENFFVDTSYQPERPNVLAGQKKWRWCNSCMGLFFDGHGTKGACPKTGGGHNPAFSANYWLSFSPPGQSGWRWCQACEGLFFAGNNTLGACPKNPNGHVLDNSAAEYFLTHNSGPGQQDKWQWCRACQGLFFAGSGSKGSCPKSPNGHDGSQSGNYILSVTTD